MKTPTSTATLLSTNKTLHLNKSKGFWHIAKAMFFVLLLVIAEFASAQSGNALQCSGGYATVTGIDISNASFTIEFWMKHTDDGNFNTAIGQGSTADNHGLHIGLKGGNQFYFNYYNNDFTYATTTDGNWHHWACVNDGTTTIRKIYKDGVLVATSDASSNFLGTGTFYIGRTSFGGGINGTLDEVRIWSIARTPTDIQADMNREVSSGTGLLAAYHCNQGTANGNNIGITTLTDATGNYTGSLNDFTLTGTTNNFVNALISGSPAALNFDGIDDYVTASLNSTTLFGSQSTTVEFWAKAAPNFSFPISFDGSYVSAVWGPTLGMNVFGVNAFYTGYAIENCWHHYAFTYDGATSTLYAFVDGQPTPTPSNTGTWPAVSTDIWLGSRGDAYIWNGTMDEVRVWNVQRTQAQLQANMFNELSGNESGLVAYYNFNQGTLNGDNTGITTLFDAQTNSAAKNGTLTGFALTGSTSNWVSSGAMLHYPEIDIQGNSVPIVDGATSPSVNDHTDFENVVANNSLVRTYTIKNTGTEVLNISGIESTNSLFTVSSLTPVSPLPVGQSATFTVTFSPTAAGTETATITVNNDDCDEAVYDFVITGNGLPPSPGAALNFDGIDDYISGPGTGLPLGNSPRTLEFWMKWRTQNDWNSLVGWGTTFGEGSNLIMQNGTIYLWGTGTYSVITTGAVPADTWTHVAMTWDGTTLKFYLNGSPAGSYTHDPANNSPIVFNTSVATSGVDIGKLIGGTADYYAGSLDEVRIWNVVRTQVEIAAYMNCEIQDTPCQLKANFHFNQGVAGDNTTLPVNTLDDASVNNNDAKLYNFALNGTNSNWISTGGVVSGTSCTPFPPEPEIDIQGNSVPIVDGATSPSANDHTDFENVVANSSLVRTYTIKNTGKEVLNISGIESTNSLFTVGSLTSVSPLPVGQSATFTVTFAPTATGTETTTITVNNDDCNEAVYDFAVTGNGIPPSPGAALDFDGSDDALSLSDISQLSNSKGFTYEAWLNLRSFNGGQIFLSIGNNTTFQIFESAAGNGYIDLQFNGFGVSAQTNDFLSKNTWTHIAIVFDGTGATNQDKLKVYANGSPVGVTVSAGTLPGQLESSSGIIKFGAHYGCCPAPDGAMDEIRIWSVARSQAQIMDNMNCEINDVPCGLAANFHLNHGTANESNTSTTTAADATGHGYDGTLSNFALTGTTSNWVAPGGVTTGKSCAPYLAPEINLQGNSVSIPDGAPGPSTDNFTDFGNVTVNGTLARTFTIQNTDKGLLTIRSITSNNSKFTISNAPTSVAANSSATFTVTFLPTAVGAQNATITVNNDDCDEAVYDFAVTGSGLSGVCTATALLSGTNGPICAGSTATFTLTGTNGATVTYTINNGPNKTVLLAGGSATVTIAGATVQQTLSLISVNDGSCTQNLTGSSATIAVSSATAGGTIAGTSVVCAGTNSTLLTLTGQTGSVLKWQSTTSGDFTNASDISNTTNQLTVTNITQTTYYRAIVKSGVCETANSVEAVVKINTKPDITLSVNGQTFNEGNNPVLCDTDTNPVNGLQFSVTNACVVGSPVWRVQAGNGAWSNWSSTASLSQPSNNQSYRYQAACDPACASTYTNPIVLTINYRASAPQNVSLTADGISVLAGESKTVCNTEGNTITFSAACAAGEILLYSVDGGDYTTVMPSQIVDGNFHNYRVRCRKADGTPSCAETESAAMSLKITTSAPAPTISISPISSCGTPTAFSGSSTCGALTTVWYNAATNQALPALPTTTPTGTTSYYARCQNAEGCLSEISNIVIFTLTPVNEAPVISASAAIVCTGTEVTLTANCPVGAEVLWNNTLAQNPLKVTFNSFTRQAYSARCVFSNGCQSPSSAPKIIIWKAFELTFINVGQSKSAIKPTNDRTLWSAQFITPDAGPSLENSTQGNPTIYYSENVNKTAPRFWTIQVETCALGTNGSLTFDLLATPELGVVRSYNTHENNAPYLMYANRDGFTELYAQNHPAYGFYEDNGSGGNVYDAGLPKGLYKLGIRYWNQKGQGSIYPSTRQPQGNVLAYQEYWFRIQSKDGVGAGAARISTDNGQRITDNGSFAEVAPNPVSNTLHLKINESKNQMVNVSLLDVSGRTLLKRSFVPETNTHQEEFEVSELTNGMYFLRVMTPEKQITLKVVKRPD